MSTVQILTDVKAINKAIDSIARRGKTLDADIQQAALSCMQHAAKHGDSTLLDRLWLSMPRGSRRASLTEYLLHFGPVQANKDKTSKKERPFLYDRDKAKAFNLEAAAVEPWYEWNRPASEDGVQEFDFDKALAALVKRASNAQAKGQTIVGLENLKQVAGLVQQA